MKNLLTPSLTFRALIKLRPIAVEILSRKKIRFWEGLDKLMGEVLPAGTLEDLLEETAQSPVPSSILVEEWTNKPLYQLMDFLTQEHRDFFVEEVSELAHLLDIHSLGETGEAADLRPIRDGFHAFVTDFERHIEEEETILFPKILRYEACQDNPQIDPEFHRGSIQNYMSTPKAKEDRRFYQDVAGLTIKIRALESKWPKSVVAADLTKLIASLTDRLYEHYQLEAKILFSAARDLERNLYNRTIDGRATLTAQV